MAELNPMTETKLPPRILPYSIQVDGKYLSFVVTDAPCWMVQRAFALEGPWHDLVKGDGTNAVRIEHPASGSAAWYRVVERSCNS